MVGTTPFVITVAVSGHHTFVTVAIIVAMKAMRLTVSFTVTV